MGLVVSVDVMTPTSNAINNAEIAMLEAVVAESYRVAYEDISSVIEYTTSGTISITIPDAISEEDVLKDLTSALSITLGVNPDRISLSLDSESGEVLYTITADDYDQANDILLELLSDDIIDSLDTNVAIDSINPTEEIIAEINIAVNAEEIDASLQQAENRINALLHDKYTSNISGNSKIYY